MRKTFLVLLFAVLTFYCVQAEDVQEFILNGDFSDNQCPDDWCIFDDTQSVAHWIPKPQIQVGYGSVYNQNLRNQRVIELAANGNTCIQQKIKDLQPGSYDLKFEYAARDERKFGDCQFKVVFNGKEIKRVLPRDYKVHSEVSSIEVKEKSDGKVQFCGFGGRQDNGYGAVLKTVSLTKKGTSQTTDNSSVKPSTTTNSSEIKAPSTIEPPVLKPPVMVDPSNSSTVKPPMTNDSSSPKPKNNDSTIDRPSNKSDPPRIDPPHFQPPTIDPSNVEPSNNKLPQKNVSKITLDSNSTKCLQKKYKLGEGKFQFSFDAQDISKVEVKVSNLYFTLDQKPVYKFNASEKLQKIVIQGNVTPGSHKVGFCIISDPKQTHQVQISNLVIQKQSCGIISSDNLIVNGGFQKNKCDRSWCIFNQKDGKGKVTGWEANPEIEVGLGSIYNLNMGQSWVAELDSNSNTCIRQRLNLKPGKHVLEFIWSGRMGNEIESDQFEVRFNDKVLKSFKADDEFNVNKQELEFELTEERGESWIDFCGKGTSDGYGSEIDNVKLVRSEKCQFSKLIKF